MRKRSAVLDSDTFTEPPKISERDTVQGSVAQAIRNMQDQLVAGELKPSVADFIRLLELQKELREEGIRDIKVTWVDPWSELEPVSEI